MSNVVTVDKLKSEAKNLIGSGFLPAHIKTEAQFLAIALKGQEVGLPPMQSISQINMIQGKPTMSAEAMLALVFKNLPGCDIVYTQLDNTKCTMKARRSANSEYSLFSFTIEDAKVAQLTSKDNWKKYPRAMLKARCISEMCRSLFPDCIAGISYTPDELEDLPPSPPKDVAPLKQEHVETNASNLAKEIVTEAIKVQPDNCGEYIPLFGKYKNTKISDIDIYDLANYLAYIEQDAIARNKQITGIVKEFLDNAHTFLNSRDTSMVGA